MKKIAVIALSLALVLTMAACGGKSAPPTEPVTSGGATLPITGDTDPEETPEATTQPEDPLEWGVSEMFSAETEESIGAYSINFPILVGVSEGNALIAEQTDGTGALISGQNMDSPKINSAAELFPAYFDQLQYTFEKYYGMRSSNYTLSLQDTDSTTIGGYEMYIFTGTIAFDYDWQNEVIRREFQFVSYATTLNYNGGYVYWLVYDLSEDQSNGDLIAQHALNMAKTFREER